MFLSSRMPCHAKHDRAMRYSQGFKVRKRIARESRKVLSRAQIYDCHHLCGLMARRHIPLIALETSPSCLTELRLQATGRSQLPAPFSNRVVVNTANKLLPVWANRLDLPSMSS